MTPLEKARELVTPLVPEDISDAGPTEDLRDYGLDSVRVMDLVARVGEAGGRVGYADLVAGPTLQIVATALETTGGNR
ncbi:phosphopantetheine-binding protein [Kineococcus sp. SYSU DK001]|uniref:phosphopantetheine-binding protein n=1 Tax=Kineococcus sp. SYSU DK001 TaxID=3383122 RepID=UPI003D7D4FEC